MENLIFCLNVTVPIFLTLLLGFFFRKIGLFDDAFVSRMNKFVFMIPLPVLLFQDIAKIDIYSEHHHFHNPVPLSSSFRHTR